MAAERHPHMPPPPFRLLVIAFCLSAVGGADAKGQLAPSAWCVFGNGKRGTKPPEIGQWAAEIGHSPFPSSGRQRAPALTRTKKR